MWARGVFLRVSNAPIPRGGPSVPQIFGPRCIPYDLDRPHPVYGIVSGGRVPTGSGTISISREWGSNIPNIFDTSYLPTSSWYDKQSNFTRWSNYTGECTRFDHASTGYFFTQMLSRDLFAVANLLVIFKLSHH